jgi:hypothetical protein
MLRADTSVPPVAARLSVASVGFYAARYRLRRGNDKFKLAGIALIPALQDRNLPVGWALPGFSFWGAMRRRLPSSWSEEIHLDHTILA